MDTKRQKTWNAVIILYTWKNHCGPPVMQQKNKGKC